jgi:hypothetical protein
MTKPRLEDVCIPSEHPLKYDWRVARVTELLLMGHTWRQVQNFMAISKPEFDMLLDAAVEEAKDKQKEACTEFLGWMEEATHNRKQKQVA